MGYIDFGKEICEIKSHTAAIMRVITKMSSDLNAIARKIESLDQENKKLNAKLEKLVLVVQSSKNEKLHTMKTRTRKPIKNTRLRK